MFDGITANALQPGTVRSNLQRYITDEDLERTRVHIEDDNGSFHWKTPEQGAATSVLLATSPLLEGIGGRYFEDSNEAGPSQPGTGRGVAPTRSTPTRRRGSGRSPSRRWHPDRLHVII